MINKQNLTTTTETELNQAEPPPMRAEPKKKFSKSDDETITALFDLLADIKEKRPIKTE